jgi:amino acid adenylation domain-containing protein
LKRNKQKTNSKEDFNTMKTDMETLIQYNLAEDFWLQKLKAVTFNPIFGDKINSENSSLKIFSQWRLPFSAKLVETIQAVSGGSETKAFLIFITALSILMYKYVGTNDILISTTDFERDDHTDHQDVLLFFRTVVNGDSIPRHLLNTALDELNAAYDHHQFEYESFFKRFCMNHIGDSEALSALGLTYNIFNRESQLAEKIDLLFKIEKTDTGFVSLIKYNTGDYRLDQVKQLGRHFMNILTPMVENLDKPIQTIDILSEEEKRKLLVDFSGEAIDYFLEEKTFLPSFERQVEKTPLSTAVVFEDVALSYQGLNEIANQLARGLLKEAPIAADDLVAIVMERSEKMVESIIAAWKCGGAYVPIDPGYPDDRIKTIIEDSRVKLMISVSGVLRPELEKTLEPFAAIIYLDRLEMEETLQKEERTNFDITVHPRNLAYVIYTSGSTGSPKGVMIEHLGMMNHLYAKITELHVSSDSVVAQNASHCFDISIWQFFTALLKGGKTVIYSNQLVLSPDAFIKRLGQDRVNILEVVPSYLSMMLDMIEDRKSGHLFPELNHLLVTGETVRPILVKRWFEKFPGVKIVNAYGPTEASDDITHFHMNRFPGLESIPIGKTLRNFCIYMVDTRMDLCPMGVKGEICVSGMGVGRGYLNDIEKTSTTFIKNPFRDTFGLKMYRTGDIGRYLPDGNIEFFGRKDYQVKIRGYRIELEEIENKLSGIKGIKEAVVIDKEDKANNTYLCGYITLKDGIEKNLDEIKNELRETLPLYMIPSTIVVLEALPLTPNGKVDRKALPEPGESEIGGAAYVAPRNEIEKKLTEIWQEVLGLEKIGIHDSFFNLGGNSLLGIRIVNKIQEWLEEVVHVTILFLAPTIEALAVKLESYKVEKETKVDSAKIKKMRGLIKPLLPLRPQRKVASKNPPGIFILCPPRSGSTLLRVIFAGHPRLFAPQEFELLSFNTLKERRSALSGKFSFYLEGVIRAIMEIKNIDADEAKKIMERFEEEGKTCQEFYGVLQTWLKNKGDKILVEKTPAYTLDLNILNRAEDYFDSPMYIHLIRNPYAVIHSFESARLDQIFKYDHHFSPRELAELVWLISHQNILEFLKKIPFHRKLRVKYEDLVNNPGPVVSGICRHFGLEYHEEMIHVYKNVETKMTDGIYAESKMLGDVKFFTHSSINTKPVEKWKEKYRTEFLGPDAVELAKSFGYLKEKIEYAKIAAASKKEYHELSRAQKRLWILDQLEENHIAYNIPFAYLAEGDLNIDILEKSYETVVKRHESLRTIFVRVEGQPAQKILPFESIGFKLKYIDLRNQQDREEQAKALAIEEAATAFDLGHGPLLRIKLIQLEETKYVFLFTMHHIISDGWSMRLLVNEILALYEAYKNNRENPLSLLRFQYKDYSEWQNSEKMRSALKRQEEYWLKEFDGEIPVLSIPTDYSRPTFQDFEGGVTHFDLSVEETKALNELARSEGASLFMVLLAVYYIFLSKMSRQEEIVVGTPTAGRNHPDLEQIIGMFVNTLALRSGPSGSKTFITFLNETREKTLRAFENQDYPFEELVEKAAIQRDISRNPLFDVMFVLQNISKVTPYPPGEIPGQEMEDLDLEIKPYDYERIIRTSKFDLSLMAAEIDERLYFIFEYCTRLFQSETIVRFIQCFKKIISSIIQFPGTKISEIEIITREEKNRILYDFNNTNNTAGYPKEKLIHQLFEEQAEKTPDNLAIVGVVAQHLTDRTYMTYKELNKKSNQLAWVLREKGVEPETIVGVMVESCVEMVIGILGILKAGGAYLPIDPDNPGERIKYMLADSNAKILMSKVSGESEVSMVSEVIHLNQLTNSTTQPLPKILTPPLTHSSTPLSPAYIIYTSGSTGRPKGVMVTHRNVIRLVKNTNYIELGKETWILQTGALEFDVSTFEIWGPLLNGGRLFLVHKDEILNDRRLKELIREYTINTMWMTAPLFNQAVDADIEIFEGVENLLVGGDVLSPNHINRVRHYYPCLNVINGYGPTENTTFSTFFPVIRDFAEKIPIGRPIANSTAYIVDASDHLLPIGIPGELVVGGDGVARGYLNKPELTAEKFNRSYRSHGSYTSYKTGDLARWMPDGNVEFLGRMDQQVKIRGYRIELEEIQNHLLKYKNIKEAFVIARADNQNTGEKYLCAYIVPHSPPPPGDDACLRDFLVEKLPNYMIPSYFMVLDKIPLTSNGKVNRKALPEPGPGVDVRDRYRAPRNPVETKLVDLWSQLLGIEKDVIGIDANFFELGGHSLKATILVSWIRKAFDIEFPLRDIFSTPTIAGMAELIRGSKKRIYEEIAPVEKREYYPQSSAQKRLFFLDQFDTVGTAYNMFSALKITGKLDKERYKRAFKTLIARHETLRTSFIMKDNQPVQKVCDNVDFEIEYYDSVTGDAEGTGDSTEAVIRNFVQPFDLGQAPLLRAAFAALAEEEYMLLYDMHHIISDGTSRQVLAADFLHIYNNEEPAPLHLQYKDFSSWQNHLLTSGRIKQIEDYWLNIYSDAPDIPKLMLPCDYPRPTIFSFKGDTHHFVLEGEEAQRFKRAGQGPETTLFMKLLAAFNILLYKYSGQEDIIVGCDIAGRPHADLQSIIGMFVNELAIRNLPCGEKTFLDFLKEVRETSIAAFENQDFQFEELVDKLNLNRDAARNPLFDVEFALQNFERPLDKVDLKMSDTRSVVPAAVGDRTAKFDIALDAFEEGEKITFRIQYCSHLFKSQTIERMAGHFINILQEIGKNPAVRISEIVMLSEEEKRQILFEFNDTRKDFPDGQSYSWLFEEQAAKTPDRIAVTGRALGGPGEPPDEHTALTYRELEKQAHRLACYLYREKNIQPGDRVAIFMDRPIEFLIAILGIMKAGSAYVPFETAWPEERVRAIIQDAEIPVVISQSRYLHILNRLQWDCDTFHTFLLMDSWDAHSMEGIDASQLKNSKELWEYIGETAKDDITEGGWISSYTGEPFTREEMDEYGDNALQKVMPLLRRNPRMRVLEIGCASGLTMYRIASHTAFYYGTDISDVTIRKNKERIRKEGYDNISVARCAAHEIDSIGEANFDLIILNSVIQSFHGHNYLRNVLRKAVDLAGEEAYIFVGDVMDQQMKKNLIRDLVAFKQTHKGSNYKTKTDFSAELFISRAFFKDLSADIPEIAGVEFSDKIFTIANELTKFRYDALITINKAKIQNPVSDAALQSRRLHSTRTNSNDQNTNDPNWKKSRHKYQEDLRALEKWGTGTVEPAVTPENLAYVIYTSGTTGRPKGVMIHFRGMINHLYAKINDLSITCDDIIAQTASASFDISVWQFLAALLKGGQTLIIPRELVLEPLELLRILQLRNVTVFETVPSLMKEFIEIVKHAPDNKLEYLRWMIPTGEPLGPSLVKQWYTYYPEIRLVNAYGPTEASDDVTHYVVKEMPVETQQTVSIGKPLQNIHIYILDRNLSLCPIGVRGEICVAGIGVGKGYWKDEEKTRKGFVPNPYLNEINDDDYATLYRTGDVGYFKEDGHIECLGRLDDQVKIRGNRIELGEIENCLKNDEAIKETVVVVVDDKIGGMSLCAYVVPALSGSDAADSINALDISGIKESLSQALPDYMIPSHFVVLEQIPLTVNGKIDRKALPAPGIEAEDGFITPRNEVEKKLAEIWSEVLKMDRDKISIDANFFDLGGHSLNAITLTAKIHKTFNVKLPLADLFTAPFIRESAEKLKRLTKGKHMPIEPVEEKEYYPLSSAQKRLYILQQMEEGNITYNMPYILPLDDDIEIEALEETFLKLIARHEGLRTSFEMIDEEPVQKIHRFGDVEFEVEEAKDNVTPIVNDFIRPFDLSCAPLLRVVLIKTVGKGQLLLVDMHHIITDGISQPILIKDFMSFYAGEKPPFQRLRYRDYSQWQNSKKRKEDIQAQENFWLTEFPGEIPLLKLPTDFPRPEIQSFEGKRVPFELYEDETRKLDEIARSEGATLFMVLLAAYNIFLSKLSGQDEIIVGIDVANRSHVDMENIIGMFVNALALRNFPSGEKTFRTFLGEIKDKTLKAFENQDYQFEDLVEHVSVVNDPGRNPIFDVLFSFREMDGESGGLPGEENPGLELKQKPYTYENSTAKFDLTLNVMGWRDHLFFSFEYCTKLFRKETIERFINYFREIVFSIIKDPDARIWEIEMVSEEEEKQTLRVFRKDKDNEFIKDTETSEERIGLAEAEFDF